MAEGNQRIQISWRQELCLPSSSPWTVSAPAQQHAISLTSLEQCLSDARAPSPPSPMATSASDSDLWTWAGLEEGGVEVRSATVPTSAPASHLPSGLLGQRLGLNLRTAAPAPEPAWSAPPMAPSWLMPLRTGPWRGCRQLCFGLGRERALRLHGS